MTVFAAAADALFADPNMAQDAVYTPDAGAPVTLRVVFKKPDLRINPSTAGLHMSAVQVQIKEIDLPEGAYTGDKISIGSDLYIVRDIKHDAFRLVASIDLDPAA